MKGSRFAWQPLGVFKARRRGEVDSRKFKASRIGKKRALKWHLKVVNVVVGAKLCYFTNCWATGTKCLRGLQRAVPKKRGNIQWGKCLLDVRGQRSDGGGLGGDGSEGVGSVLMGKRGNGVGWFLVSILSRSRWVMHRVRRSAYTGTKSAGWKILMGAVQRLHNKWIPRPSCFSSL